MWWFRFRIFLSDSIGVQVLADGPPVPHPRNIGWGAMPLCHDAESY